MVSLASLLAEASDAVGNEHARPGSPADAVDGLVPSVVAAPGDVAEASALLAAASRDGAAVVVRGGASKLAWASPVQRLDLVLETRRLTGLFAHDQGDLVLRASAGWALAELHRRLASSGQRLCLDPDGEGATLGGVIACADAGPLRLRYGTPRDLVIGVTAVLADGTVARAGGRVVKNVAGYDLVKLYCGSFGTLGLIAEVTLRLHPAPAERHELTVHPQPGDLETLRAEVAAANTVLPTAFELVWQQDEERPACTVRLEGGGASLRTQREAARVLLGRYGEVDGSATATVTTGGSAPAPTGATSVRLRCSVPPDQLQAQLLALRAAAAGAGARCCLVARAGNGIVDARFEGADEEALAALIEQARRRLAAAGRRGGSLVVTDAPLSLRRALEVWGGPAPGALALMRRVKQQFDPGSVLAPGRFVGGI